MPKLARPWYRSQTDCWYVEIVGTQRNLGHHPEDAPPPKRTKHGWNAPQPILKAFHALMADDQPPPKAEVIMVVEVCDRFLEAICPFAGERPSRPVERRKREKETGIKEPDPPLKVDPACDPRTFWWYDSYLQDFCKQYGRMPALSLDTDHVTRWLDAHPGWTTARRSAITAVKRAFNWAVEKKLIPSSPIKALKKPSTPSRARVMTREERKEILAAIPDEQFRLFVEAMQESGCRPSEVSRVTATDVNLSLGIWLLQKHKMSKKTGKPRIVYLTPRLTEITKQLMEKNPEGALFRGPRFNRPFGMQGICSRFRRLREKLPHLKDAIAYAYRHSFATDALTNGVGVAHVATLMGHNSTDMIFRHYGHLAGQIEHMKEAAKKATA